MTSSAPKVYQDTRTIEDFWKQSFDRRVSAIVTLVELAVLGFVKVVILIASLLDGGPAQNIATRM